MAVGSFSLINQAGITYRQLDTWVRNGIVSANYDDGGKDDGFGGSGRSRSFSTTEAQAVIMIGKLVKIGLKPSSAEPIARALIRGEDPVTVGPFTIGMI